MVYGRRKGENLDFPLAAFSEDCRSVRHWRKCSPFSLITELWEYFCCVWKHTSSGWNLLLPFTTYLCNFSWSVFPFCFFDRGYQGDAYGAGGGNGTQGLTYKPVIYSVPGPWPYQFAFVSVGDLDYTQKFSGLIPGYAQGSLLMSSGTTLVAGD